jgi:hypothetical protein|tara:strand:+ start:1243 stop:1515 length:273 start_codon:yes stop_codon:yes gene_type:complete
VCDGDIFERIARASRVVTLLQNDKRKCFFGNWQGELGGRFLPVVKFSSRLEHFLTLTVIECDFLAQTLFKIEENMGTKLRKSASTERWPY